MQEIKPITSAEEMIAVIRELGIVPFTKCAVEGWSIQELTDPDYWFMSSDELGPWDWKIDAVQSGILYGKFISRKSAFATVETYRHLMNWRRSLPYFRMAEGGRYKAPTIDARLQKYLSPTLLDAIRAGESLDSGALRGILEAEVPMDIRKKVGGHVGRYLIPKVTKQAVDFILSYLDMGTWTVIGDITRVYRGPNCEYKGWQRNTITTPDALIQAPGSTPAAGHRSAPGSSTAPTAMPFWAKYIDDDFATADDSRQTSSEPACSPEESRALLMERIRRFYPHATDKALERILDGK